MILIAFNISHTQNTKGHSGSEKTYSNFTKKFSFPNAPIWIKVLCKDCIVCQLNKPYLNQKQIEWILVRDKKHNETYQKVTKKLLQRQNINEQINSRFTPATDLEIGTFVLIPNFNTQKEISKKLQPLRKGPYK